MRLSVSTAGCMNVSSPKIVYVACCIYCVDRVCCMLYSLCWRSMLHTVSSALTCMLHAVSSAKTGYATYCIFCIDGYSACCISWKYVICSMLYPLRWQGMLHAVFAAETGYAACRFYFYDRVFFILYLLLTHWILQREYAACVINWKHIAWCMLYLVHMLHGEVCHCRQCFNFFSLFLPGFQVGQEYTRSIPRWIDTNRMSSTIGGNAECVHSQFSCIYVISVNQK